VEDSRVVDQHVGTTQVVSGPLDSLEDFFLFGNVAFQRVDFSFGAGIQILFQRLLGQKSNKNSSTV
jgi:hypothetical protein